MTASLLSGAVTEAGSAAVELEAGEAPAAPDAAPAAGLAASLTGVPGPVPGSTMAANSNKSVGAGGPAVVIRAAGFLVDVEAASWA